LWPLDDGRRTTLIFSDAELSSFDRVLPQDAKQHFSLGKAGLSTEDGQKHLIILVILAYLIFNDLHRFILEKTKSQSKRYKVFETIQRALSMLRSLLLEQALPSPRFLFPIPLSSSFLLAVTYTHFVSNEIFGRTDKAVRTIRYIDSKPFPVVSYCQSSITV